MSVPDCAILVPSWDGYADLWRPFVTLLFRHWPDCPFPVYLGANDARFDDPRVHLVRVPRGLGWSTEVRRQLETIPHTYVMIVLEDFFWRERTPTAAILDCLTVLERTGGHMLRLVPRPGPDRRIPGETRFGEVTVGAPYRVSTQAALWRRSTLLSLLVDGESAWEFELNASRRSDASASGFFATWTPLAPYGHHVVERGKWFRHEAKRLRAAGIGCDFETRATMTRLETAAWHVKHVRARVFSVLPACLREPIKRVVRWRLRRPQAG